MDQKFQALVARTQVYIWQDDLAMFETYLIENGYTCTDGDFQNPRVKVWQRKTSRFWRSIKRIAWVTPGL